MRKACLLVLLAWAVPALAQTLSPDVKQFVKVDAPVVALEHVRVILAQVEAARAEIRERVGLRSGSRQ